LRDELRCRRAVESGAVSWEIGEDQVSYDKNRPAGSRRR